jgi:hypothetical protein
MPPPALRPTAARSWRSAAPHVARAAATTGSAVLLSRRDLPVNDAQKVTLGIIAAYVVAIALLWNLPYIRWVLWPFKVCLSPRGPPPRPQHRTNHPAPCQQMLVIAFHEFGHAFACILTGGRVKSISLDPREGGVTHMPGGRNAITLPAGYRGSSLIGALLTFAGFNINASKIASIVIGVCFVLTLWWGRRDWLTIGTVLAAVGLLVGCWFIAHAEALRFVVLFIGVMSSLYSVWDIVSSTPPPPLLVPRGSPGGTVAD